MSAPGIRHPVFGLDCDLGTEPQLCSRCDKPIPEEDVPLIVFGDKRPDGDCFAWVYCDLCTVVVLLTSGALKS